MTLKEQLAQLQQLAGHATDRRVRAIYEIAIESLHTLMEQGADS